MTLLDVLPMAIGINKADGTMHVLFGKNQPLPDYKTRTLTTSKDNQRSIMLKIYQGESKYVAENELLGTFVFSGLRPAPKGQVKIEVTFHIDSEGILNLTARDRDTGQLVESRLKLGKEEGGGGGGGAPKKKKKKAPEAPKPPPVPLSMPSSSLRASAAQPPPEPLEELEEIEEIEPEMEPLDDVEEEPVTDVRKKKFAAAKRDEPKGLFARIWNLLFGWMRRSNDDDED
jgi:molecular chaperone DnaK (HSP70)